MGLRDWFSRQRRTKAAEEGAEQLYMALLTGAKLELPQTLSMEDPTVQAVAILRKRHPDVSVMLQSGSLVLCRVKVAQQAISNPTWNILDSHGYFPDGKLPAEVFLGLHEAFMRRNNVDPKVVADEHERERLEDTRIEVLGG